MPVELKVTGAFPEWICGNLYRTGPGKLEVENEKTGKKTAISHWFDGLARHHKFEIKNGKVTYRSRDGSETVENELKERGSFPGMSFGQKPDPCERIWRKLFTVFRPAYNPPNDPTAFLVAVTPSKGLSLDGSQKSAITMKTDANIMQSVDPETLEPIEAFSYARIHPELTGPVSASHSCRDSQESFNYVLALGRETVFRIFKHDDGGHGQILATIKDAPPAYLHSLFLTKRFVILAVWQCDWAWKGLPVLWCRNMVDSFAPWDKDRDTIFYVISRTGGIVAKYTSPTFFAFHTINSYDDHDGSIILDLAMYPDNSVIENFFMDRLRSGLSPLTECRWRRFRLRDVPETPDKVVPTFRAEVVFTGGIDSVIELPSVAPPSHWKPYRYAYGIHVNPSTGQNSSKEVGFSQAIIKVDTWALSTPQNTNATPSHPSPHLVWRSDHLFPGEPVLVLRPLSEGMSLDDQPEDDGVLLLVTLDISRGASGLLVLDAKTLTEIARAELPDGQHIPFDVHGMWDMAAASS
ncbi:hypothetical protein SISNIDRAFT_465172 [Sistotremastrum niveocremeum HHB9708]|uniref:Carotenoid oxygenase n=1 Tax=Sistotremastrum niveocremeum HHB9708 TaxID=1314777 RepID=A0A164WCD4_9AGAM|nr:hypothetical protein SISNIDRAFT_465172 [Sistotremastrum niveocremeum HHB9708]